MPSGVIIADDDSLIRSVLRSMCEGIGESAFLAANGAEAVAFSLTVQARLIVLDLDMPGLNGIATCEKIRAAAPTCSTPIVILTAHHDGKSQRAAARAGATLFVKKPFQPAEFLHLISPFLGIDATTREAISRAALRAQEISAPGRYRAAGIRQEPHDAARDTDLFARDRSVLDAYRTVDRRKAMRYKVNFPCRLSVFGRPECSVIVTDVSAAGAGVRGGPLLRPGIRGALHLDSAGITLPFVVRDGQADWLHVMFELDEGTTARFRPILDRLAQIWG